MNENIEQSENDSELGRKFDQGKDRWDLIPLEVIEEAVKVLTFGAEKYEPNNWQKIPDFENRYFASMMRHIVAHKKGEKIDPKSSLKHLAHASCCLMFLLWKELQENS